MREILILQRLSKVKRYIIILTLLAPPTVELYSRHQRLRQSNFTVVTSASDRIIAVPTFGHELTAARVSMIALSLS